MRKEHLLTALILFIISQSIAQTSVTVTTGTARVLPDEYYGLNGTNTIDDGQGWNTINSSTGAVPNDLNLNLVGNCNIRYPGGTVGNYWDWRNGYFLKRIPSGFIYSASFEGRKNKWYDPSSSWTFEKPDNRQTVKKPPFQIFEAKNRLLQAF